MILKSNNILLREIRESDLLLYNKMMNSQDVEYSVVGWNKPVTNYEQNEWYKGLKNDSNIRYTISNLEDTEAYGTVFISKIDWKNRICGVDIKIAEEFRKKGIGKESVQLIIKYIFDELNMNRISISILETNLSSQHLFESIGFVKEGVQRSAIYKGGNYIDLFLFGLLKEEYYERNRK